jgi:hypothetical protein
MKSSNIVALLTLVASMAVAASAQQATAALPRTADGKPDFQGLWSAQSSPTQAIEEHGASYGSRPGKSVVVDPPDGRIPYQPAALAERDRRRRPENNYDDPDTHCFPPGVPRQMYDMQLPIHILQPAGTPGYVVMLFEIAHTSRIVPTDGRPHARDGIRVWNGDSVGRWEGDTLVIDTVNNNGKNWLAQYGDFIGAGTHIVERLKMTDANTIDYRATIEDPALFTRPWTIAFALARSEEKGMEILEAACHEENLDLEHLRAVQDAASGGAGR